VGRGWVGDDVMRGDGCLVDDRVLGSFASLFTDC
jgi:hypothetical protein